MTCLRQKECGKASLCKRKQDIRRFRPRCQRQHLPWKSQWRFQRFGKWRTRIPRQLDTLQNSQLTMGRNLDWEHLAGPGFSQHWFVCPFLTGGYLSRDSKTMFQGKEIKHQCETWLFSKFKTFFKCKMIIQVQAEYWKQFSVIFVMFSILPCSEKSFPEKGTDRPDDWWAIAPDARVTLPCWHASALSLWGTKKPALSSRKKKHLSQQSMHFFHLFKLLKQATQKGCKSAFQEKIAKAAPCLGLSHIFHEQLCSGNLFSCDFPWDSLATNEEQQRAKWVWTQLIPWCRVLCHV